MFVGELSWIGTAAVNKTMVRNTCTVDDMDVTDWHVDIGGNYVEKSCQFSYMLKETELTRRSSTVEPSADAQFRSPQSNRWLLQSMIIQARTSDNSFYEYYDVR